MNGQNLTEWRNRMKGKQMTKLQKKYINKMLNTSVKKSKEFENELKKESFENQMGVIKEKLSPNGGKKPFQKTDG